MSSHVIRFLFALSMFFLGMASSFPNVTGAPLPITTPAEAGFSEERLRRLRSFCETLVKEQKYSALAVLLARDGNILEWQTFGKRDGSGGSTPLQKDDIYAIYSLTKIVTTVGALILVEEGKLTLREPVSRYIPALASAKVFRGGTVEAPVLEELDRPITVQHLLTHTAGFSNFDPVTAPVLAQMRASRNDKRDTLEGVIQSLLFLPLQHQPGEAWVYGPSTDVLGYLIERVSGVRFEQFLEERIFKPLGMHDTFFEVPSEKRARQVAFDVRQSDGTLKREVPRPRQQPWASGGGGLYSTQADYIRFAQMLLNRGQLDGVQILSPKMIELMAQDHLQGLPKPTKIYPATDGFGFGVEIRMGVALSGWLGSEGTFGWNGASTTYCSIDPAEGIIAMIWAQHIPNSEFELYERFNNLVYQALMDPQ